MITIEITDSPFMELPTNEADQWMNDNIGELTCNEFLSSSTGKGWKIYVVERDDLDSAYDRWYVEFEDDKMASYFILRWL